MCAWFANTHTHTHARHTRPHLLSGPDNLGWAVAATALVHAHARPLQSSWKRCARDEKHIGHVRTRNIYYYRLEGNLCGACECFTMSVHTETGVLGCSGCVRSYTSAVLCGGRTARQNVELSDMQIAWFIIRHTHT